MAQTGGVVRFCMEGDCILSSPRSTREPEKRPWHPVLNPESVYMAQRSLTPNLNSGRIQLLRKSLTPEARRAHLGMYNSTGSLIRHPAEIGLTSGRFTAPCTPVRSKQSHPLNSPGSRSPLTQRLTAGQSSVVTFTFIEKASVKTVNGIPAADLESKPSPQHLITNSGSLGPPGATVRKEVNVCRGIADVQQRASSPQLQAASPLGSRVQLQSGSPVTAHRTSECCSGRASPCITDSQSPSACQPQDSLHRKWSSELSPTDTLPVRSSLPVDQRPSDSPITGRQTPDIQHKNMDIALPPLPNGHGTSSEEIPSMQRSPMRTESPCEADSSDHLKESSSRAQRIAKAKWEFFYGSPEPQRAVAVLPTDNSPKLTLPISIQPNYM